MTEEYANTLKDHFLIAMPGLCHGIFANSVTYICEHNEHGAMGIVINHPLNLSLEEILEQLEISNPDCPHPEPILAGGPVSVERGFVLHNDTLNHWDSSLQVTDGICLTSSRDILNAIARNEGPAKSLVALGYAGWGAGQLEEELADNAWLTAPADEDILFNTPIEFRANKAASKLGIDLSLISAQAGHA
jgi:putative transcriptional regulator